MFVPSSEVLLLFERQGDNSECFQFSVSFDRYENRNPNPFPHSRQPAARDNLDLGKADGIDLDDGKDAGRDRLACYGGGDGWRVRGSLGG